MPRARVTRLRNVSLILVLTAIALAAAEPPLPEVLQSQLEEVVQAKARALLQLKDADGVSNQRGIWSRKFRKTADGGYDVTFTKQTAYPEKLASERYRVTLKNDAAGKWAVADEKLEDTFEEVYRDVPGDEQFFRFEKFTFQEEGFKVTATNGTMVRDTWAGRGSIGLAADSLAYTYEPPVKATGMYAPVFRGYRKDYPKDLVFAPELAGLFDTQSECDRLVKEAFVGVEPIPKEQLAKVLLDEYEKELKETKERRKNSPFLGFNVKPHPDRAYRRISVKRKGNEHYFSLSYDNYEPKEVQVRVSQLGDFFTPEPILAYYSEQTLASGTDPSDLERREDVSSRDYELTSLKGNVEMALSDDPEMLKADLTFQIKLKRDLDSVEYQIARLRPIGSEQKETKNPKMTVNAVELGDGTELSAITTGPARGQILLPETAKAGSTITLRMQFENRDSIYKLTPSFSYVDRGGWLPFVRFGDMIDGFDLTIRVPSRYKILGIGKEVYQKRVGDIAEARYTSASPVTFPSIIFGDYIDDKPSFEVKKTDGTVIPVNIYVDKTAMSDFELAPTRLRPLAEEAANALLLYTKIYGKDYPFAKLDLVNDAFGGFYGQAPSSIVYLGTPVFKGRGMLGAVGGANLATFARSVVAHEVAHQWWGALVSNSNNGNYWFVESLAEYSSALFMENVYSGNDYMKKVEEWRRVLLERDVTTSVQDASVLSAPDYGSYQASVYDKGPYAFHILRTTFGDEKFFAFLKTLATELAGKEIVSRDIQKVAEQSFGGNMEWFFDQWIRGTGIPQYSFNYETRKTEDGKYLISGKIKQRVVSGKNKYVLDGVYFTGIVPITVIAAKGKEFPAKIRVQGAETPFQFKVSDEPVDVVLNKYGEILAHDVLVNRPW